MAHIRPDDKRPKFQTRDGRGRPLGTSTAAEAVARANCLQIDFRLHPSTRHGSYKQSLIPADCNRHRISSLAQASAKPCPIKKPSSSSSVIQAGHG